MAAHGLPPATAGLLVIPLIMTVLALGMVILAVVTWVRSDWGFAWRVYYTLLTLAAVALIWWLNSWNLLGWRL